MKQDIKSNLTQQLILQKAFGLFHEHGFNKTSVDKIVSESGLTKGAVYHHFKNKKAIGVSVISNIIHERIYTGMIAPLYQSGNPHDILLETFTKRILAFSDKDKILGCPANNFINEIGNTDSAYKQALKRIIEEWKTAIIQLIQKGQNTGVFKKNLNPAAVAVYLISAFEGIRGIRKLYDEDSMLNHYLVAVENYINDLT